MAGTGLNFQTHQFVDPSAQLQTALGAGGMFAQTLKSMQQFDQDQQKMDMMRADRERQAKLDAKAEAADVLAAKKEAYNIGAEKAINSVQAKDDLANQMFQRGLTNPEQAMLINQADSQIKASNAGFKVADSLVGLDRSKLSTDQQKRYDELASADANLDTKSYNGKDSYNISTKLGLLKDAYALGGLGEKEAYDKAAKSLGISSDTAKGVTASNDEQSAFVNRYSNLAQNDPLFGKSNLEKLTDYEAAWGKEHGDTEFSTTGVQGLKKSLISANTVAIAEQKKELNDLYTKRAMQSQGQEDKNLDTAIRLAEMRIRAADHETSSEEKLAKALTGVVGSSKLTDSDKYAINLASHLKQYATSSKPEVGQNIISAYKQAQAKGYSAAEAAALIQGGIHADGIPDERQAQQYKFDSQAMFNQAPKKAYADNTDYVALRQQQLASNDAQKEAEFDQLQKLFAAKGGSSTLAALDKQIYDIKRTPQEAFRQAAMQAGKDFAYDRDLAGHKNIADTKIASEQTANEKIGEIPGAPKKKIETSAGPSSISTGNGAFDLPQGISQLDNASIHKIVRDKSAKLIRDREGTKDGIYNVDTLNKDGTISKIPHIGYGLRVANVAKENKMTESQFIAGYNNPSTRDKFAAMAKASEENNLTKAYTQANSMAKEAGLTLEAVPVLASTIYNLGPKWADKSNKNGFSGRWELIKKGEFTKAADGLDKSLWSKQAEGRPQDLVAMLNDQAMRKGTKFYNKDFNVIASPEKMSDAEFAALQKRYRDSTSPDQYKINELTSRINKPEPQALPMRDIIVKQNDDRPLATWFNNLPARYENMVASNINEGNSKRDADLKNRLNSERTQMINSEKQREYEVSMLLSESGLSNQYKNAKTESAKKLVLLAAEQFKKDKENAERGQMLKAGLFH